MCGSPCRQPSVRDRATLDVTHRPTAIFMRGALANHSPNAPLRMVEKVQKCEQKPSGNLRSLEQSVEKCLWFRSYLHPVKAISRQGTQPLSRYHLMQVLGDADLKFDGSCCRMAMWTLVRCLTSELFVAKIILPFQYFHGSIPALPSQIHTVLACLWPENLPDM